MGNAHGPRPRNHYSPGTGVPTDCPPQWLLRETVLALQERLLAEFGGLSGLRDAGLLDSALALAAHEMDETGYAVWLLEHQRRA